MSSSALAVILFIAWALFLLVLMEGIRSFLVVTGRVRANEFKPDNTNLSPFMQRLARAHANCVERVAQSTAHLASLSLIAVNIRFAFFAVQMVIGVYWAWALLAKPA